MVERRDQNAKKQRLHALVHRPLAQLQVFPVFKLERGQPLSYLAIWRWIRWGLFHVRAQEDKQLRRLTCRNVSREIQRNQRNRQTDLVHSARFAGAGGVDDRDGMGV